MCNCQHYRTAGTTLPQCFADVTPWCCLLVHRNCRGFTPHDVQVAAGFAAIGASAWAPQMPQPTSSLQQGLGFDSADWLDTQRARAWEGSGKPSQLS